MITGGTTALSVNGSGIFVTIRNVTILGTGTGPGSSSTGQVGVDFVNGSLLHLHNVSSAPARPAPSPHC
jgi:hypothetical protein